MNIIINNEIIQIRKNLNIQVKKLERSIKYN